VVACALPGAFRILSSCTFEARNPARSFAAIGITTVA
jgi:hypothetical protein